MPPKTADQIEVELWALFDAGTNLGDGRGPLNRNKTDTEKSNKSNRKAYRKKIEELLQLNKWTPAAEAGVHICAGKAGAVARLIADEQEKDNCTLKIFNLACDIVAKLQAIDAQGNPQAQGIIC